MWAVGIVRMGLVFFVLRVVFDLHLSISPLTSHLYHYLQAPARAPVVPSGVVLAAAPASSATLVDVGDNTAGNNAINAGNMTTKKTKNNEKALLLSDDEFQ